MRRTNFDKQMLIDKHFAYRGANPHRFGATHPLFSPKRESPSNLGLSRLPRLLICRTLSHLATQGSNIAIYKEDCPEIKEEA